MSKETWHLKDLKQLLITCLEDIKLLNEDKGFKTFVKNFNFKLRLMFIIKRLKNCKAQLQSLKSIFRKFKKYFNCLSLKKSKKFAYHPRKNL
jgi:hypothetical protein